MMNLKKYLTILIPVCIILHSSCVKYEPIFIENHNQTDTIDLEFSGLNSYFFERTFGSLEKFQNKTIQEVCPMWPDANYARYVASRSKNSQEGMSVQDIESFFYYKVPIPYFNLGPIKKDMHQMNYGSYVCCERLEIYKEYVLPEDTVSENIIRLSFIKIKLPPQMKIILYCKGGGDRSCRQEFSHFCTEVGIGKNGVGKSYEASLLDETLNKNGLISHSKFNIKIFR